jgi:hypothetical protein
VGSFRPKTGALNVEFESFNVLDILPGIAAPRLVLHCRDDAAMPFEQGWLIASCIPGARFVALESRVGISRRRHLGQIRFAPQSGHRELASICPVQCQLQTSSIRETVA